MNKLVVIVGPTAVGKTSLSIELAKHFSAEIISGDSMQVYKHLNIGTDKVSNEEKKGIPHYMIDIVEPTEKFTVADFKKQVHKHIEDIQKRSKLPILVGGSGLYIQSVLYEYHFLEHKRNEKVTKRLEKELTDLGKEVLYERLKKIDPKQAKKIHPNNHRRLIRALEIYESTGKTMSQYIEEKNASKQTNYDFFIIGLNMERQKLYERINKRVDFMIEKGLIEEIDFLLKNNLLQNDALQAIGYKEFIPYFNGEICKEEAINLLKRNSRRFAKRQLTWFKNQLPVQWYDISQKNKQEVITTIKSDLEGYLKNK